MLAMSETFAELFESSLSNQKMYPGAIVTGRITGIENNFVTVNVGLKSEGRIPLEQFQEAVNVGDDIEVAIDAVENGRGETRLSREKAQRAKAWISLSRAFENGLPVMGIISGKVKGGFTVELESIRAFLPGSLVDVRPVRDTSNLEGRELEFKVIKLDQKRNNVVVSRRSVVESESSAEREELLGNLQEGQEVNGVVKNLTDYGAFVDLGGIDGLLHITDMAWRVVIGILNAFHSYNCIHIEDLWVDSAHRSKGYGKQLIVNLIEHFKGKGFDNINCITCDYQAPDFYRKCGFTEEFVRVNNKNPKFTMTFFIKFFD
jgi:small subunit ribosomal protein S1